MKILFIKQSILLLLTLGLSSLANAETKKTSHRILFTSCIEQYLPQPLWQDVQASQGDMLLLIGDNVYADSGDPEILKRSYDKLNANPGFQEVKKIMPVSGTWDDHDYGLNDAGREHPGKDNAQKAFLDFFEVPQDSPRRQQQGIYHSHMLGEPGKRVQIILLDTRYFRGPLNKNAEWLHNIYRYSPSQESEQVLLGEAQWLWLEQQLREPAELRIIVSSIQLGANNHGSERWETLPKEKQRLFDLIKQTDAKGILFISGDRHLSQLMQISPQESGLPYPLYDLTSSSFNKSVETILASKIHPLIYDNFSLSDFLTSLITTKTPRQVYKTIYDDNFGVIDINWQSENPRIELSLIGEGGKKLLVHTLHLNELQ